jgi:hypothetical protein
MLKRFYQFVVLDSIAAMERPSAPVEVGGRSPLFKATTALVATALLLILLNFVALNFDIQDGVAVALWSFVSSLGDGPVKDALLAVAPPYRHAAWTAGCVVFYFVMPAMIVRLVFRQPLAAYGLTGRAFFRHLPIYLLLLAPVLVIVLIVSGSPAFQATYPFYKHPSGWADLLVWEVLYVSQFFALEFFFRGFMLHATRDRLGALAVPVMLIPYVMIHFTKPMPEALGAVVAGTVLGVLSLRTGTILGGVLVHAAVAVAMDVAALVQRGDLPGMH